MSIQKHIYNQIVATRLLRWHEAHLIDTTLSFYQCHLVPNPAERNGSAEAGSTSSDDNEADRQQRLVQAAL